MKRAFAYIRVSGKSQLAGDGFTRQRTAIQKYARDHKIRIDKEDWFEERGISGTRESMDRPAWRDLMAKLHSNGVHTVIIEKLDRLARDLMIQESVIADLRKNGFELISVHEPDLMANDPTRTLLRQVLGAVAEYDKGQIVAKLRGARMRQRALHGRCEGRKPYGHRAGEQEQLHRMQGWHTEGWSYRRIATQLNEEGVAPRSGARWHPFSVQKILARA